MGEFLVVTMIGTGTSNLATPLAGAAGAAGAAVEGGVADEEAGLEGVDSFEVAVAIDRKWKKNIHIFFFSKKKRLFIL